MDKKTVIGILKDEKQDKRSKFSSLLMALNQAPVKNFALTAHYNRVGFSEKNLSSIEYDVKKAFSINAGDLRTFKKTEAKPVQEKRTKSKEKGEEQEDSKEKGEESKEEEVEQESKKEQLDIEKHNEQLKDIDTKKADYQEMVSLAFNVAEQLNIELPDRKKATIVAFLEEQKKSLASKA